MQHNQIKYYQQTIKCKIKIVILALDSTISY